MCFFVENLSSEYVHYSEVFWIRSTEVCILGVSFPNGGSITGSNFPKVAIFPVAIFLVWQFSWWQFSGVSIQSGSFPGDNFPKTETASKNYHPDGFLPRKMQFFRVVINLETCETCEKNS